MADAVTIDPIATTDRSAVIHLTNLSDGTGESAISKVVRSAYSIAPPISGAVRLVPLALDIVSIRWAIQGFTSIKLFWDYTTPQTAMQLCSSGFEDFSSGWLGDALRAGGLLANRSGGATGDIKLTTAGAAAGATYDITIVTRLANQ